MTGWLALVGGFEWSTGCSFDKTLLERSNTNTVTVLPTAAAFENPDAATRTAAAWFATLGAQVEVCPLLNRHDAEDTTISEQLTNAEFIYIAGGNPMHLRATLKDSAAFDAIRTAWTSGATVAASSAGAMALCDPMLDPRGGAFTLGLGLITNAAVLPHANSWSDDRMRRTRKLADQSALLVMIDERTALLRPPDGAWNVEGVGSVRVHAHGTDTSNLELLNSLTVG